MLANSQRPCGFVFLYAPIFQVNELQISGQESLKAFIITNLVIYNKTKQNHRRLIGGFRDSQNDIISGHAHIHGRQRYGQLYGICVKYGFVF